MGVAQSELEPSEPPPRRSRLRILPVDFEPVPDELGEEAEPAPAPAAAWSGELLVGAGESIMDAVRRAGPGQTIRLAPGRYVEQVVLNRDVHVVGPREAVLEWDKDDTLKCRGPAEPSVRGITIRNVGLGNAAVWITSGSRVVLEGCDVSCPNFQGVTVIGEGTAPTLRSNAVHGCGTAGIWFQELAGGIAEGNDIFGNEDAGIAICGGADPLVRGNTIRDQDYGVRVFGGGRGAVTGNTLERIGARDLIVMPDCTGCRVEGNTIR